MDNELKIFEGTEVDIIELNGEPMFEVYTTGMALGQVKTAKEKAYPRKDRIDENVKNADIKPVVHNGQQYINESQLYDLMLEVKTDKVKPFRKWITTKVLPTIRKTGGYVNNDELFINTYLDGVDDDVKQLFRLNLVVLKQKDEIIKNQRLEIEHKEDVIIGLVDEITLAEKRQILNRVMRHNHANYQLRWQMLYREFDNKYHINTQSRMDTYNETHKPKCKNKLDYIENVMNKIPELYEIATKLFENDVKELVDQMYNAISA